MLESGGRRTCRMMQSSVVIFLLSLNTVWGGYNSAIVRISEDLEPTHCRDTLTKLEVGKKYHFPSSHVAFCFCRKLTICSHVSAKAWASSDHGWFLD